MGRLGYRLLVWLLLPWVLVKLWWRGRREAGYRHDVAGRFGSYRQPVPTGPLLWLHAVSVGETMAAQPLVRALLREYPQHRLLITHMTASGRDTALRLYAGEPRLLFSWLPYDYPFAVRRFLEHYRPALGIIMETELWPHLLEAGARAGVPLLLANARLSRRSADGYTRVAPLVRGALSRFDVIAAQTQADAEQFARFGATRLHITGNIKFDVQVGVEAAGLAAEFRRRYGERQVFLAASLREGEEALLLDALAAAGGLKGGALLVMVPRHPQRFDEVATLLSAKGVNFLRRSADREVPADCACLLGDSMGEMAAYYAASDLAFIGGSLLNFGGQNLIEACAAGVPVLVGPYTRNFAQAAEAAVEAGAALRVNDAGAVIAAANRLLGDAEARLSMGTAGRAFCASHRGATARTLELCRRALARAAVRPA